MNPLTLEEAHLVALDRFIAEAQTRIAAHMLLIRSRKEAGFCTASSEQLLAIMQEILQTYFASRKLIESELERQSDWLKYYENQKAQS